MYIRVRNKNGQQLSRRHGKFLKIVTGIEVQKKKNQRLKGPSVTKRVATHKSKHQAESQGEKIGTTGSSRLFLSRTSHLYHLMA